MVMYDNNMIMSLKHKKIKLKTKDKNIIEPQHTCSNIHCVIPENIHTPPTDGSSN